MYSYTVNIVNQEFEFVHNCTFSCKGSSQEACEDSEPVQPVVCSSRIIGIYVEAVRFEQLIHVVFLKMLNKLL